MSHKATAFNSSKANRSYYFKFYKAIRQYGLENFTLDILEECSIE